MRQVFISFFCVNLTFNGYLVSSEEENNHRCVESCKEGEQERFYDDCYFWSKPNSVWADPAKKNWKESNFECNRRNGTLAAVTSLEIHNFLLRKVDKESKCQDT